MNNQILEETKVPVDCLKELYIEMKERLATEEEIGESDITPIFWKGIKQKLQKGENPVIVTKGQTTKGKSTANIYIGYRLNLITKEIMKDSTLPNEINMFPYISSNQIEFLRIARRTDMLHVWTCIDEFSNLGVVGANSTTEQELMEWYDKVCAQKFIYRLMATPRNDYDKYGLIILSIIDLDKKRNLSKLKVYYNNPCDIKPIYLGILSIDVSEILNKDWYKLYMEKKHFAMDLMLKHGIKDQRELEFSLATLIGYEKNKKLLEIGIKDNDIVATKMDSILNEMKQPYSIISKDEIITRVRAFLTLPLKIHEARYELTRENRRTALSINDRNRILETIKVCEEEFKKLYDEQLKLLNLYIEYLSIGDNLIKAEIMALCDKYKIGIEGEKK